MRNTEGSAIRRIGHARWQRNLAVALGNAPYQAAILKALRSFVENCQSDGDSVSMVLRHVHWAIAQQLQKADVLAEQNRQQQRLIRIVQVGLPRDA